MISPIRFLEREGNWNMRMVSKKDFLFIGGIFLFVIIYSLLTGGDSVNVKFQQEVMSINATDFEFHIAYEDIVSAELIGLPEFGTMEKGKDAASIKSGNWKNDDWGIYHLCVIPSVTNCVDVTLADGRHVVFNYKNEESTQGVHSMIQDYIGG